MIKKYFALMIIMLTLFQVALSQNVMAKGLVLSKKTKKVESTAVKKKLGLNKSIEINNVVISLDRIEKPKTNVPGSRSTYFLSASDVNDLDSKVTFRFDPFNSGKPISYGKQTFLIFADPTDENAVMISNF
jgi:hypothetical protein